MEADALCMRFARHGSRAVTLRSARIRARRSEVLVFARSLVSPARARLLEDRARLMRFSPTRSEEWLWRRLSGSKTGFPFRRQLVIGPFIVDFACTKLRLVVEVDGPYHERRRRPDARRDAALARLGWHVLHIEEQDVFDDFDGVVERISASALARVLMHGR